MTKKEMLKIFEDRKVRAKGGNQEHHYDHVQGLTKRNIAASPDFDYDLLFCEDPDTSSLSKEDMAIIDEVMSVLAGMKRSEVVELSHKEDGWINNKDHHDIIPYAEAYSLKGIPSPA